MHKTVLITGASSGIGLETVQYFANKGWNVAATMRTPGKEAQLAERANIRFFRLDVTDEASIDQAVKEAINTFGDIDVVVNNAGYAAIGALEAATYDDYYKQFDTNVFGIIRVMQVILPYFRQRRKGLFINLSSIGEAVGSPFASLYHGTKWAVGGMTESLMYELSLYNIQVKLIMPPAVKTDFFGRSMNFMKKEGVEGYDKAFEGSMYRNPEMIEKYGIEPVKVAKAIYKAATDGRKKLRYPVGPAKAVLAARWIIPGIIFYAIVKKVTMKVQKDG